MPKARYQSVTIAIAFSVLLSGCGESPKAHQTDKERPDQGIVALDDQDGIATHARDTGSAKLQAATRMLLIVIDTLRAKQLGCYGFPEPTTPTMDRLAAEGVLFETLHAASPWTAPAFGSIFTGVSPTVHGSGGMLAKGSPKGTSLFGVTVGGMAHNLSTLPEMLPPKVTKAAFVTNAFVSKNLGFDRGFDHFDHRNANIHHYRKADEVTDRAIDWLEKNHKNPFFVLLHYMDPHVGYGPPKKYIKQFAPNKPRRIGVPFTDHDAARDGSLNPSESEKKFIRGLYSGEVRFVDDQISRVRETMDRLGLLENTWIVVTADHGEEIFEHGSFEHGHAYEEEVTHIPLILRAPGGKWRTGQRIATSVRQVDLPPTLLDLFKVKGKSQFEGMSLLPVIYGIDTKDRPAFIEYNLFKGQQCAYFDGRYKFVWDKRRKRGFYYDLQTDPGETSRIGKDGPMYKSLLSRLTTKREELELAARGKKPNEGKLSGEAVQAIKSLGYVE